MSIMSGVAGKTPYSPEANSASTDRWSKRSTSPSVPPCKLAASRHAITPWLVLSGSAVTNAEPRGSVWIATFAAPARSMEADVR